MMDFTMQQSILIFPRTPKHWLYAFGSISIISLIAFGLIYSIKMFLGVDGTIAIHHQLFISFLYTTCIVLLQTASGEFIHKNIPLNSNLATIGHILIQSLSVVVAFYFAQRIEYLIYGDCVMNPETTSVALSISFLLSFIANSAYYIRYFYKQAQIAQQMAVVSELSALRAQINPHFLFNTLNSIAALIRINPDDAEQVTESLADLFRYSLRASKTPLVTLDDEIHSVELYLSIEKARFGSRLITQVHIPDYVRQAKVPSLLLQPLVENCIKHGANVVEGVFSITVQCSEHNNILTIRIEDSGPGFNPSLFESYFSKGSGLMNVRDRLRLLFTHQSNIHIEQHAVVIIIPFLKELPHTTFHHTHNSLFSH